MTQHAHNVVLTFIRRHPKLWTLYRRRNNVVCVQKGDTLNYIIQLKENLFSFQLRSREIIGKDLLRFVNYFHFLCLISANKDVFVEIEFQDSSNEYGNKKYLIAWRKGGSMTSWSGVVTEELCLHKSLTLTKFTGRNKLNLNSVKHNKTKILKPISNPKSGSRHTAHAAKALRRKTEQVLKCLIKKRTLSS